MIIQVLGLLIGAAVCAALYVALSVIINLAGRRHHIVSRLLTFVVLIVIGAFASTLVLIVFFGAINFFSPTLGSVAVESIFYAMLGLLPYPPILMVPRFTGYRVRKRLTAQPRPDDITYLTAVTGTSGRIRFRLNGPAVLSESTRYQKRTGLAFVAWTIIILAVDQLTGGSDLHVLSKVLLFGGIIAAMLRYIATVTLPRIGDVIAHEVTRYIDEIEMLESYDQQTFEEDEPAGSRSRGQKMSVQQARLILGIDTVSVSREQLNRAYKEKAKKYHPDTRRAVSQDQEHMKLLNRAKDTLERIVQD